MWWRQRSNGQWVEQLDRLLNKRARILQETLDVYDQYVDPSDALRGPHGDMWTDVSGTRAERTEASRFRSEGQLTDAREKCRALAFTNEFAINAIENRISYVIGTGHSYTVTPIGTGRDALAEKAQTALRDFIDVNRWHGRQQEIFRRRDRDGEVFLRFFETDGILRVRFVEPGQIGAPEHGTSEDKWGIRTDPDDVETVLGYWVDGELVDPSEIQHRKLGVDCNVKRGVPLLWAVHTPLQRIEQLQRNMDAVAAIQTAIAMIRKHQTAAKSTVETFKTSLASLTLTDPDTGKVRNYQQYRPGSILDVPATTDYQFPSAGVDASRFVAVKQAALRAVASRMSMPEFMLSAKSDDVNYASALVAEGPAVKMFERLQAEQIEYDKEVLWRALAVAGLPDNIKELVTIDAKAPNVASRDKLEQAKVDEIYLRNGVKSIQTISTELGLDYTQEQQDIVDHGANTPL